MLSMERCWTRRSSERAAAICDSRHRVRSNTSHRHTYVTFDANQPDRYNARMWWNGLSTFVSGNTAKNCFEEVDVMAEGTIEKRPTRALGLSTLGAARTYFFTRQTAT